ncbi:TadE/TadG family type IV pilus assembly protein [Pseudoduganella sp. OTU4001]|uniref:TadE/TadG family type IV pilus assembly protein n=1 Tax=Pseudoduganella sp. OTU4001 TaxID=3043854 RepID=UPI00313D6CD3
MRKPVPNRHQQRGSVAVMTGLMLMLVLIPVSGLVIDLGHLYIVKTELQNMADSAALAAGKDLDNTDAGLDKAVASGIALASKNRYDFGRTMTMTSANFRFADNPEGPWYTLAQSKGNATGRTFVEVDTRSGGNGGASTTINTWLMRIAGDNSTSTYSIAVAGRFVNTVTPIGICAIDPTRRTANYNYGAFTEIVEYGFRRGMSYNLFGLGTLGGASSDPYTINPINSPPTCVPANSSTNVTAPFICAGNSAVLPTGIGQVYTNTGVAATLSKAFNSRFNDYSGGSKCDPATAPPDKNIQPFSSGAGNPPANWQDSGGTSLPSQMSINTVTDPVKSGLKTPAYALPHEATAKGTDIWPSISFDRGALVNSPQASYAGHGVTWAYTPAVQSDGSTAILPAQANSTKTTSKMYGSLGTAIDYIKESGTDKYPDTVGNGFTSQYAAPYNQASGPTFLAPTGRPGVEDRRILNIVLIDCSKPPTGSASCGVMDAVGIGKFFMLKPADIAANELFLEFTGLVEPVPSSEVKLYK